MPDDSQNRGEVIAVDVSIFLALRNRFLSVFLRVLELDVSLELTCVIHSIVSVLLVLKRGEIVAHLLFNSTLNGVRIETVKGCIL